MLRAFAEAASILDRDDYREVASSERRVHHVGTSEGRRGRSRTGQRFCPEIRLYRTYKDGKAHIDAFAEDYAFYADGLISLYEATFEPGWVVQARGLITTLIKHFFDTDAGGFFTTGDFHEELVARPKELYDNAIPSANSVAVESLLRLYLLSAEPDYERFAVDNMPRP